MMIFEKENIDNGLQFYRNNNGIRKKCIVIDSLDGYMKLLNDNKEKNIKYTYPNDEGYSVIETEKCLNVIDNPEMIFTLNARSLPCEFLSDDIELYRSLIRIVDHENNRYNLLKDDYKIIYYVISQDIHYEIDIPNEFLHLYNMLAIFSFE